MNRLLPLLLFLLPVALFSQKLGKDIISARAGLGSSAPYASYTPDGKRLVVGAYDGCIRVADLASGNLVTIISAADTTGPMPIALSPDGGWAVSGDLAGEVKVWDLESGELLHTFTGHTAPVAHVAFLADGSGVAAGDRAGVIRVYDLETDDLRFQVEFNQGTVLSMDVSPNGKYLAACNNARGPGDPNLGYNARVWDQKSGALLRTIESNTQGSDGFVRLRFSHGGDSLVLDDLIPDIIIWDLAVGAPVDTVNSQFVLGGPSAIEFTPDGKGLMIAGEYSLKQFDLTAGAYSKTHLPFGADINSIRYSPDRSRFITTSDAGIWEWKADDTVHNNVMTHDGAINALAISPDGTRLTTWTSNYDRKVRVFDAADGTLLSSRLKSEALSAPQMYVITATMNVYDAEFMSDGRRVVLAGGNRPFAYDLATGAVDSAWRFSPEHRSLITDISVNEGAGLIATSSIDSTARIWSIAGLTSEVVLKGHESWLMSTALSRDGSRVVTGSMDRTLRLWNTATGEELMKLSVPQLPVVLTYTPDGSLLLVGMDISGDILVLNPDDLTTVRTLKGHTGRVNDLIFSSDGAYLYSAGNDPVVRVWDMKEWKEVYAYSDYPVGQGSLALSKDGSMLISGGLDGGLIYWRNRVASSSVEKETGTKGLHAAIVPNPAVDRFEVAVDLESSSRVEVDLLDMLGRTLFTTSRELGAGPGRIVVDPSELPSGGYLCVVRAGERRYVEPVVLGR